MNKEQQDLLWANLPKEERTEQRELYRNAECEFDNGANYLRKRIFGSHNLTSDTEPEEVLTILRKDIIEEFNQATADLPRTGNLEYKGKQELLKNLFCDKCLPEKEEPKPKFKAGDEVWYGVNKCTINKIEGNTAYIVYNNGASWENISQLRPYIEPNYKFGIGDKVKFRNSKIKIVRRRFASPYDNEAHYSVETLDGQSPINVVESDLEPYTEEPRNQSQNIANCDKSEDNQLRDNMEDKEPNLCELLKDYIGDTFFHPHYGDVELTGVDENFISVTYNDCTIVIVGFTAPTGMAYLYPDAESLKKYPFDGKVAWDEWASERKPKRWRAKSSAGVAVSECEEHWEDYSYWYISSDGVVAQEEEMNCKADNLRYELGNYFRTKEEAEQDVEAVREAFEKFHEKVAQSK